MKLLKYIVLFFERLFFSKEQQARRAGVVMGKNNFVDSRFWSTEPYLITIGNDCALTTDCQIFTHGGGEQHALNIQILTVLAK